MNLAAHLRIAGGLQVALCAMHAFFPARFRWREELAQLSLLNRQMFEVHTFFVALVVLMSGLLALCFPSTLLGSGLLSRLVLSGAGVFWFFRLLAQLFVYSPQLWRGNRPRTAIHVLFIFLWTYLAAMYGLAAAACGKNVGQTIP